MIIITHKGADVDTEVLHLSLEHSGADLSLHIQVTRGFRVKYTARLAAQADAPSDGRTRAPVHWFVECDIYVVHRGIYGIL